MLDGSIGEPFKRKKHQSVYRIATADGTAYLKRTSYQPSRSILRHLLRGRTAHTESGWEYFAIRALQAHGFRVMDPILFAEQKWFGLWPRRGFLLVRSVTGRELADILTAQDSSLRCEAFGAVASFLARLHGTGFFHAVRFHDFLYEVTIEGRLQLTMIDVDFKGMLPDARSFELTEALEALAQSCYLFLRNNRFTAGEARRFLREYRAGLRNCGQDFRARDLRFLIDGVRTRLKQHARDPNLKEMYPNTPIPRPKVSW
jgi:hypothetical protein